MAVLNKYIQSPCSGNSSALLCTTSSARRNSMKHTPVKLENISKVVKYYGRSPDIILKVKSANFDGKLLLKNGKTDFRPSYKRRFGVVATLTEQITPDKGSDHSTTSFTTTYPLRRCVKVDGKITARVDSIKGDGKLRLSLGCDLPGSWVLHWGVIYSDDPSSEWDQPPPDMRPPGSVLIKDYAAQTPFVWAKSPVGGQRLCNVQIDIKDNDPISAIHFVLKDEETGTWYKDNGKDFKVLLSEAVSNDIHDLNDVLGLKKWPGILDRMSGMFLKPKQSAPQDLDIRNDNGDSSCSNECDGVAYEEYKLSKETVVENFVTVSVRKSKEKRLNLVSFDTDLPGDVVLHWGVCRNDSKKWEILMQSQYPSNTTVYRRRALQTPLQRKEDRTGSWGVFCIDEEHAGLLFVLKRKGDSSWINNMGDDFYIPLIGDSSLIPQTNNGYSFPFSDAQILDWASKEQLELGTKKQELERRGLPWASQSESLKGLVSSAETQTTLNIDAKESLDGMAQVAQDGQMEKATDEIVEDQHKLLSIESTASEPEKITFTEKEIGSLEYKNAASILLNKEIKRLVESVSTGNSGSIGSTAIRDKFLQEIEKLAAVAYNSFKDSPPVFTEEPEPEVQVWKPKGKPCSGTGLGNEVLLQGFNWESHHSGRWYCDLSEKATEIASCGFTIVWLPPPTDSVSPEGYMPRDLHNLNSRYGSMEELKKIVKQFHDVGLKVLGDVVLNHRCAQYQNHNGIWNIFGGRLNWDDRAIVSDDPHFQGRGNRSSGDSFHAAPNIDHSQEFVRRDLIDWLCWLRSEIGYDGWRLDFVRGFWGGYVKDYLEGTEPYFAVGEYWDSLSYTYGQMDHNQDAHRQRIVDWINATGGNAGAFDVTTKGILHTTLEKCEYWRLADQKQRPPGVVGWWPSRAVTFIENHDTGSTQGHWRFPAGKEIQGYAYILTHPGTPTVFYDHLFSHNRDGISALVALRKRAGIHCRSVVHIEKAERDVYAAKIDDRVLVKIGPGHYQPPNGSTKWIMATEGQDYKVWEAL
eukprot:Gb_02250 [translate_table: standard]